MQRYFTTDLKMTLKNKSTACRTLQVKLNVTATSCIIKRKKVKLLPLLSQPYFLPAKQKEKTTVQNFPQLSRKFRKLQAVTHYFQTFLRTSRNRSKHMHVKDILKQFCSSGINQSWHQHGVDCSHQRVLQKKKKPAIV